VHTNATSLQAQHNIWCLLRRRVATGEVTHKSSSVLALRLSEGLLESFHIVWVYSGATCEAKGGRNVRVILLVEEDDVQ